MSPRTIRIVVLGVIVLLALPLLIGLVISPKFESTATIDIAAPADVVYEWLANPLKFKLWNVSKQNADALQWTTSGAEHGEGAVLEWTSDRQGSGRFKIKGSTPGRRVQYTMRFDGQAKPTIGMFELDAAGTHTRVRWSTEGEVTGMGPLNGYMAWLVGLNGRSSQRDALERLEKHVLAGDGDTAVGDTTKAAGAGESGK